MRCVSVTDSVSSFKLHSSRRKATAVIRFSCPHCSRRFEVAPAMTRLPLLCKGCGQALVVPESSTEPEPQPEPPKPLPAEHKQEPVKPAGVSRPAASAVSISPAPVVAAIKSRLPPPEKISKNGPPAAYGKVVRPANEDDLLFEKADALAELDEDPRDREPIARPPTTETELPSRGNRKLLGLLVDATVILVLLVAGTICGELLARQSTREVLTDAGSAAKFPPVELLMWLAPTLVFLLIHALLISRGKSVGNWLRRRAESN